MAKPEADFAAAAAAFQRGDLAAARNWGLRAVAGDPAMGAAHHLLAIVADQSGDLVEAVDRFTEAVALLPEDPHLANNFGNFAGKMQQTDMAMEEYRRAIGLAPDFVDALVNLGLTAGLAHYDEGLAALQRATRLAPKSAKAWHALGAHLRDGSDLDAAAEALATAATLAPGDVGIIQAQAVVEAARGGNAIPYLDRASELKPGDPELALERAAFLFRQDPAAAIGYLAGLLRGAPAWQIGHLTLSQLRWQNGDGAASTRSFDEALAATPDDLELRLAYLSTLQRAGRHADAIALADRDRSRFDARPESAAIARRFEAISAAESGKLDRAAALFAGIADTDDANFELSRLRFLLRAGQFTEAARHGEQMVSVHDDRSLWAHLATAWRMVGDRRADWLDDPRAVAVIDIGGLDLAALADRLRALHVTNTHPFDQSLRGGTQTDGNLLLRNDPVLKALRAALEGAAADYIQNLPPIDPVHPTLRERRDGFRIKGSWSVRLSSQGFHINHFHGDGWISSAFYVALPPTLGDAANPAGWLTLGQPSEELGLNLPPLHVIEPKPARLVLFPSTLWHGTLPFSAGERLTVAFDIVPKGR